MMKGGKAMGPDGVPIEVWRCFGDMAIYGQLSFSTMIGEWRKSVLVPIFKNKGDIQSCTITEKLSL